MRFIFMVFFSTILSWIIIYSMSENFDLKTAIISFITVVIVQLFFEFLFNY